MNDNAETTPRGLASDIPSGDVAIRTNRTAERGEAANNERQPGQQSCEAGSNPSQNGITVHRRERLRFEASDDRDDVLDVSSSRQQSSHGRRNKRLSSTASHRRWSSRRGRFSRRFSHFSEDILTEDYLQTQVSPWSGSRRSACLRFCPLRLQAIIVAVVSLLVSFTGIIITIVYLIKTMTSAERHTDCTSEVEETIDKSLRRCQGHLPDGWPDKTQQQDVTGMIPVPLHIFLSQGFLWSSLILSTVFFWCSACLFGGIWCHRRRLLVPWLLVSGITGLFFLMTVVWVLICNRGTTKLFTLVPAALSGIFLYWWLLVNNLLEEMHEEKKAAAVAAADLENNCVSEGIGLTTTAALAAAYNAATVSSPSAGPQELPTTSRTPSAVGLPLIANLSANHGQTTSQ